MNPIVIRILERHRTLLLMSAAMLCGGVAIYAGSRYVNEQVQAERARLAPVAQQMVDVVVANATLDKGNHGHPLRTGRIRVQLGRDAGTV